MKKYLKSALALVMCCCIAFAFVAASPAAKAEEVSARASMSSFVDEGIAGGSITPLDGASQQVNSKQAFAKAINFISNLLLNKVLLNGISMLIPKGSNVLRYASFDFDSCGVFFSGSDTFIDEPVSQAWSVGYGQCSIIPDDFGAKMKYARGSYVPWWYTTEVYTDDDGNQEDLKVRTVILDDGRGKVVFSVIDCIGLSNTDVRKIREAAADISEAQNIISLNVSATHTHSGIDSQGVWNSPLSTMANNFLSATTGLVKMKSGVDEDFLQTMIDQTVESIRLACADMTDGKLFYADADIGDYVHDRTPPYSYDQKLYRLVFKPFDENKTPTIIATFGCHPESASYDFLTTDDGLNIDTKISADFVYYMEKLINKAGYNFIYIQGDVGTVTSSRGNSNDGIGGLDSHATAVRFGYELGYITLGLTMSEQECAALNTQLGDVLGVADLGGSEGYSVWYEGHTASPETEVEPILNIRHEQFLIEIENSMVKILTKTGLASNAVIHDWKTGKYYTLTEIGYMELGDTLKVFLCPGETFNEIVLGGDCLDEFQYASLRSLYGENLIVFDLMNDAAGYIEPDNYYVIAGYQYDEAKDSLESDTWCLLVSLGKNTASTIAGKFIDLVGSVR